MIIYRPQCSGRYDNHVIAYKAERVIKIATLVLLFAYPVLWTLTHGLHVRWGIAFRHRIH